MPALIKLVGSRFGRLVVLERDQSRSSKTKVHWICQCDCGTTRTVAADGLRSGDTKSCGCLRTETTSRKNYRHGMTGSGTYATWSDMVQRCTNPNNSASRYYSDRGITVCERWREFTNFLADMGKAPPGMMIERNDNNKGYEPGNCRWATRNEQMNNRSNNVLVEYQGTTMTVAQAARLLGIKYDTLHQRVTSGKSTQTPGLVRVYQKETRQ